MADITKEDFVIRAVKRLRDESKSKGIHARFSGFNEAFKLQFGEDSKATTDKMVVAGELVVIPTKGGVRLYLPDEAPIGATGRGALDKILS